MRCAPWGRRGPLLLIFLFARPVLAGPEPAGPTPPAPSQVLDVTFSDIVRLVDQHPRLAAGRLEVEAARGGVDAAGEVPNPTLEGNVGEGIGRLDGASSVEWGLALTVPLGWIAQRGSRIDAAQAEVDVALAEALVLRRDVLLRLGTLFFCLAYEQARVASLEELEAQTAELVRTIRMRVDKGATRPVEATRVEIELEKVASDLESARTSLSSRQAELALWLGAGAKVVAVADLAALPVAPDREAALAKARRSHPSLAVAAARTRVLEADVGIERMARVPELSLTGFTSHELDRRAYGVGLAVDLPLWSWNTGRIEEAEASLAASRKRAEAAGLELGAAVIQAQSSCAASVATAARLRDNVVPRSESAASTMEKTYELGEANLIDVIDARRTLLESRRLYVSALAQARIDCSRLDVLIGEEPE